MNIKEMTIKQLRKLKYYRPTKPFNAIVIVPTKYEYDDNGFKCMDFILCNEFEIVGKVGGGSDVININGIGGLGKWNAEDGIPTAIKPIGWSIDCIAENDLIRLFTDEEMELPDFIGSAFQIYIKQERRIIMPDKEERIKELREMIDSDIESVGGVEEFNNYCCAHECITSWIDNILDILEIKEKKA